MTAVAAVAGPATPTTQLILEVDEPEEPVIQNVTALCRIPECAGSCGGVYKPSAEEDE